MLPSPYKVVTDIWETEVSDYKASLITKFLIWKLFTTLHYCFIAQLHWLIIMMTLNLNDHKNLIITNFMAINIMLAWMVIVSPIYSVRSMSHLPCARHCFRPWESRSVKTDTPLQPESEQFTQEHIIF